MDAGFNRRNVVGAAAIAGLSSAVMLATPKKPVRTTALAAIPTMRIPSVTVPADGRGVVLEEFWPDGFRRETDDASQVIEAAANWSAHNRQEVRISGRYFLANPVAIRGEGTQIIFSTAHIIVADKGRRLKTKFGQSLPLAFLVSANNVSLLGQVTLQGLGIPGETLLQGIYCEEASGINIGNFTLRNMAIGQHFMCCDNVRCGETVAFSMWGRQPSNNERAGAGSAQVISGCRKSAFGRLQSWDNDKPARYLSVGKTGGGEQRDNISNQYGFVEMTARDGSPWAQVTGIRSSVNSRFEGGSGKGAAYLLLCQKYKKDSAYNIDGNDFGNWSGDISDRWGSVEAGAKFAAEEGAKPIGRNSVRSLSATSPLPEPTLLNRAGFRFPQTFGIYMNSGELTIGELDITGFSFQINAFDSKLDIGIFHSRAAFYQPFRYGHGLTGSIQKMIMHSDISGPVANAGVLRAEKLGTPGKPVRFHIDELDCSQSATKIRSEYVVYDPLFDESAMTVKLLGGQCGNAQGFARGRKRKIKQI
jgi:hypothetical protein